MVLTAFIIICANMLLGKKEQLLPFVFLILALGTCLVVGLSAPNSGAIFRYRSPAMIFLLLAALYELRLPFKKKITSAV